MVDQLDGNEMDELKLLVEKNSQAIQTLRVMVENMEILLARLSASKKGQELASGGIDSQS